MILSRIHVDKNLTPRTPRWRETKFSISKIGAPISDGFSKQALCFPLRTSRPLREARKLLTASFRLRACLKSLPSECGRPRPQHCTTSNRSQFLQCLSQCRVAAPEDGRTPSKIVFTPKCIFRQALTGCAWRILGEAGFSKGW